jgi:hypothetical protein
MCGAHMRRSVHARSAVLSKQIPGPGYRARDSLRDSLIDRSPSPCPDHQDGQAPEALGLSVIGDASSYGLSKSLPGRQGPLKRAASIQVLAAFGSARWTCPAMPPGNQCCRVAPQSWGRAAGSMTASPTTAACASSVSMANPPCAEPRRPTRLRRLLVQGRFARPVLG